MRIAITLLLLVGLAACTATPRYKQSEYAEIVTDVAPGCDQSSVHFRELRDEKGRHVALSQSAVRVRPGVYDIGLSCGVTFDPSQAACIAPEGNVADQDVPTYKLIIRPKVRYLFSCLQENSVWTYHMVESNL